MTTYISVDKYDLNDKINCLLGYCEVFVKHFGYLRVHGVRVPDELPNVIEEANGWIDSLPSLPDKSLQIKELIERKRRLYISNIYDQRNHTMSVALFDLLMENILEEINTL